MTDTPIAERIGAGAIDVLTNRKGLRHEIDNIDEDMLAEIIEELGLSALDVLAKPTPAMVHAHCRAGRVRPETCRQCVPGPDDGLKVNQDRQCYEMHVAQIRAIIKAAKEQDE